MRTPTRTRSLVPERQRGVIDTSVVIDLQHVSANELPSELAITAITLAELAAGPLATNDPEEQARRQDRLQRAESTFQALPFDTAAARAYGRIYATVIAAGRRPRGRQVDLLIAATVLAEGLPLYTCNPGDFEHLTGLQVFAVTRGVPDG